VNRFREKGIKDKYLNRPIPFPLFTILCSRIGGASEDIASSYGEQE
jgi:hypothetical protein